MIMMMMLMRMRKIFIEMMTMIMMFGKIQIMIIRVTVEEVRVLEPLIIFSLAYLSYITAGMFSWSPIISLIGCGLVQVLIINI